MWQVRYVASAICGELPKPFTRVVAPSQVHKENFKFFFRKELQEGIEGKLKLKLDVGVVIAPLLGRVRCSL